MSTTNQNNIQWFPGHMAKAKREMQDKIKLVDLVIEIRDARIPLSSKNPLIDEIIGNKKRIIVLSKADKAEHEITEQYLKYFNNEGNYALALNLINNKNVSKIICDACSLVMKDKIDKLKAKGLKNVEIKAMVVGVPNVGKSTLINSVSKRKAALTSDRPGVTKSLQWIKISPEVALLDTPGVLWPKFDDSKVGYLLAITGAINDNVLPLEDVCHFAVEYLLKNHPEKIINRYNIEIKNEVNEIINKIGISRGCLLEDKSVDYKRLYTLILRDIRDNDLGPISWEKLDEDR